MFADDFTGVAETEEALQCIISTVLLCVVHQVEDGGQHRAH
jgi:hypothetical protein